MAEEIELASALAHDVVATVAGTSPGREALEWAADVIRGRRARTQIKVLQRTGDAIAAAGLRGHVVPDKTLVPLLEFAGLEDEDDEEMIDRWARLLATAATTEDASSVPPAFPEILRQLEPAEAQYLEALVDEDGIGQGDWSAGIEELMRLTDAQRVNLQRLGMLRASDVSPSRWVLTNHPGGFPAAPPAANDSSEITALGVAFVLACRGPQPVR